MAQPIRAGFRIFVLILLILTLILSGLLIFDYLGLMDVKETFRPAFQLVGIGVPRPLPDDPTDLLIEQERLSKREQALELKAQELQAREEAVQSLEQELEQKLSLLEEQEAALQEKEKSFNESTKQYENKRANLRQQAADLVGMPPEAAVEILLAMEDQAVIDLLRTTEEMAQQAGTGSIVPFWKSLMPPDRVAVLQRKELARQ